MRGVSILAAGLFLAGAGLAQPPRTPGMMQYDWWNRPVSRTLDLSDVQTKKLNEIQQAYVSTLMELNAAVGKAEKNLNEIYNQDKIEEMKAGVAVDQYVNARDNLTRVLTEMSLKMRAVLTIEQWQQLANAQYGRGGLGRGGQNRGRRGAPVSGAGGTTSGANTANKVTPPGSAIPQSSK